MASRPADRQAVAPPPGAAPRVRAMVGGDLARVVTIERETFTMPWSEGTFADLLERTDARCLVAELEGVGPVGYAVFWWTAGEAELGDLAVWQPYRGAGIGARLLVEALDAATAVDVRRIFLEVRESNSAARTLYRRHGFRVVGRRPDYYRDPREDAIVMLRTLVDRLDS